MPRVFHLPPLQRESDMSSEGYSNQQQDKADIYRPADRQNTFVSSDPQQDQLPVDCILVYTIDDDDHENESNHKLKKPYTALEDRRKKFEHYLKKEQGLILQDYKSPSSRVGYVKVSTPFEVLLSTAEKMRMRLPIARIEKRETMLLQSNTSWWKRLKDKLSKPFLLDPALTEDDLDYYTAIYSRNILKFKDLQEEFEELGKAYFTPAERSLLTHELLSRTHSVDNYDDDRPSDPHNLDQSANDPKLGANAIVGSQKSRHQPVTKKVYDGYFPLHESLHNYDALPDKDLNDRQKLQRHWATMRKCFKFQPFALIRSYMGEKVAFYFAMTGFYNQMLIAPAIVGLIIFIYGAASVMSDESTSDICGDFGSNTYMCPRCDKVCPFWKLSDSCVYSKISYVFDNAATIVFGIFMSLWARLFVQFWGRRQAAFQYEWDSIDFEAHLEPIRPEYERQAALMKETREDPVTGIKEPNIPIKRRIPYFILSVFVVIITILIVCGTIFGTIVYRVQMDYILRDTSAKTYSSIIITVTGAVINLICSLILSQLYYWLAGKITDLELHKHQSKYDDSLIIKIYLFQFMNFYGSIFYIAFFKGRFLEYPSKYGEPRPDDFTEQCDPAGCLVELSIQLVIIMIGKQIINNIVEFFTAMRRTCMRVCYKEGKHTQYQWEEDNTLYDFNSTVLIDEYLELVIQFGFVTLFVVAFPLAPLFALINNLVELRLDAWKFLSKYKRPIPFKASDIGIWSSIFSAVSYLAVLTNAIIIAWTSEFIPKMAYRVLQSKGTSLDGYVNWTLSSFSIQDYNNTGQMPPNTFNLTYCRYRDFRESTSPYSQTTVYWNVLAARLAFIIVFEHLVFFIIYLMYWLVPSVPKTIQNKIDRERYIDQRERWASKERDDTFKDVAMAAQAAGKLNHIINNDHNDTTELIRRPNGRYVARKPKGILNMSTRITPENES
ncbi:unnamed protein product [Adineta ricciae]|uniref:Anoctamin n=1 Tax=Adineta ricciae TaxID=249248 RepID=A0A814CMM1_ADIRI|nr:unnamed protein product [Adineta ricciae]